MKGQDKYITKYIQDYPDMKLPESWSRSGGHV